MHHEEEGLPSSTPTRLSHWIWFLLSTAILAAITYALYYEIQSAYLFEDDFQWLVGALRFDPEALFRLEGRSHFYRPVVELYFSLANFACGPSSTCYHLLNVLLHILNTLLVLGLIWRMTGDRAQAFLVALLFACQPSSAAAVSWVSSVTQLLSTFFYLSALLLHLDRRRFAAVFVATLSFLSHESAVTLPAMLALTDWASGRRTDNGWRNYASYALVWMALLWISFLVNSANYVVTKGHYAVGLHPFKKLLEFIMVLYVGPRTALAYILVCLVILALLVWGSMRARFYTLWVLATLLPFTLFTWEIIAPRYAYLSTVGFAGLLAEAVFSIDLRLPARIPRVIRHALAVAVSIFLVSRSASFTAKRIDGFVEVTTVYRDFVEGVQKADPEIGDDGMIQVSAIPEMIAPLYVEPALRWAYQDASLTVALPP